MTRRSQKSMKDHLASSQGNLALPPPLPHLCTMRFHAGYKTKMFLMLSVGTGHSVPQCLACTVVCGAPVNQFRAINPTWNWNSVFSTLLSRMAVFNIVSLLKFLFLFYTSVWKVVEKYYPVDCVYLQITKIRDCHSVLHNTTGTFEVENLWDQISKWNWFTLLWIQRS